MESVEAPQRTPLQADPATTSPAIATTTQANAQRGFTVYDGMLLFMTAIWAANPAAIKWALQYMDPLAFNALRFGMATLVPVTLVLAGKEDFRWRKGDGLKIAALGLIGHGLYQTLFILGTDNTLAGNVALILSINPAFVAVFGAVLGYERISRYTWIGVSITLMGVVLVVAGSGKPLEFGSRLLGDLIIVVVTIMWALYTVLSQPILKHYSSIKLNALTMPIGSAFLLVVATPSLVQSAPSWPEVPGMAWLLLGMSGIFAVSASYIIWYKGVQKLGATRTAVYSNIVPVLAAFISFFILGEPLGWQFWAGMVLVITGVSLARFGAKLVARLRQA
ncbi:MAG TPA: DMT family transporter [Chloroflexia bacterium]|jgi:drug/metabolite transporter (DMT)-like permease